MEIVVVDPKFQTKEALSRLRGLDYRVAFNLYDKEAKREAEVREFSNGEVYSVERELVEGSTFRDRDPDQMVGPFASPEDAERFIVASAWFCGREE